MRSSANAAVSRNSNRISSSECHRQQRISSTTTNIASSSVPKTTNEEAPSNPPWTLSKNVPPGFWRDPANHKRFFDWAARKLEIVPSTTNNNPEQQQQHNQQHLEKWYSVSRQQIFDLGGYTLLSTYYKGSLIKALEAMYPHYEFLPWRFKATGVPRGFWRDEANRRRFFEWAEKELGVERMEDWYNIKNEHIAELGGSALLGRYYDGSLSRALSILYPHVEWIPWKFTSGVPNGFWEDRTNHKRFFDWVAKQVGVVRPEEDWYSVSRGRIFALGGTGLLNNYYEGSLSLALATVYPEVDWTPWRFEGGVPLRLWSNTTNQRKFFEWAAKSLGITTPEGWYDITANTINKLAGPSLLNNHYKGSLYKALATLYPEYKLVPWRFDDYSNNEAPEPIRKSSMHRDVVDYHWQFFNWAAKQLNVRAPEDWFRVTKDDLRRLVGGKDVLAQYQNSLAIALSRVYPEFEWHPWRFEGGVPIKYWKDQGNQRRFFDWAASQLGVTEPEGWYNINREDIIPLGGMGLLVGRFGGSLLKALASAYPEVEWHPWRFRNFSLTTTGNNPFDNDTNNTHLKNYVELLRKEFRVKHFDDWYRVSMDQLRQIRGYRLIDYYGSLCAILKKVYPEHDWDEQKFHLARGKKSSQWQLKLALQEFFPGQEIIEEYQLTANELTSEVQTLDL